MAKSNKTKGTSVEIYGELEKVLDLEDIFDNALNASADDAANLLYDTIESEIVNTDSVASGAYLKSVTAEFQKLSSFEYLVKATAKDDAAIHMELGRRPRSQMPPVDAIVEWMVNRGLGNDLHGAYLIARKIGRDGFDGRHIFENASIKAGPEVEEIIQREIENELNKS